MIDPISLTVAIGAVIVSVFIYWETRNLRRLTQVMVESLAFIAKSRRSSRKSGGPLRRPKNTPPQGTTFNMTPATGHTPASPVLSRPTSATERARIELAQRREERKRLELQLRQQREQWKRQKEFARAIGWVLDRMGSDEEEDDEEEE